MTVAKMASEIAKLEGKKSQARIGDIREILKIIVSESSKQYFEQINGGNTDPWTEILADLAIKKANKKNKRKPLAGSFF